MPRSGGQLERSLAALTIGHSQDQKARKDQLSYSSAREVEQQVRVPISGTAGNGWGLVDVPVGFKFPFLYAPIQRPVPYGTPHFSYGVEMGTGTNTLIVVHAQILTWNTTDSGWIIGATVRLQASAPQVTVDANVNFSATAHLRFQGYAAESEEGEII